MDEFEFFDKTDIKDISKRTRISVDDLNHLKNEEFDKLNKTKGLGFIKILEREYLVDLSSVKEKFILYLKEHDKYSNKEFFIAPAKKRTYTKPTAVFLLMVVAFGIFFFFYSTTSKTVSKPIAKLEQNPIINETKDLSGIEINSTNASKTVSTISKKETNSTHENKILSPKKEKILQTVEKNTTIKQTENKANNNISSSVTRKDINISNAEVLATSKQDSNNTIVKNNLTIVPKKRLWVGVVTLDNYKKRSYLTDKNISIDVKSETLIATGHGEFTLDYDNKTLAFSSVNPIRFLIKDGNITKISKKDFIKLNKGRYW